MISSRIASLLRLLGSFIAANNTTHGIALSNIDASIRSQNVKYQIKSSFIYRTISIAFSFWLVRVMLNYLDSERYGIWLTVISMLSWFTFFDFGLGNGLKNKVSESIVSNDERSAKIFVSTTYAMVAILAILGFVLVLASMPFLDLSYMLNTRLLLNKELTAIVLIVAFFVLLNFVIALINPLLDAYQQNSTSTMNQMIPNIAVMIFVFVISFFTRNNLLLMGIGFGLAQTTSNVLFSYLFYRRHRELLPGLRNVSFGYCGKVIRLGAQFFLIQIAVLIIFTTDNLIIAHVLGPAYVTEYNIVYKLFSIVPLGFSVIFGTLWSAYTEAYAKKDLVWIRSTIRKLNILMLPTTAVVGCLVLTSDLLVRLWVGKHFELDRKFIVLMGVFTIISTWNNIYAIFVNGIGAIRPQVYCAVIGGLINIPLAVMFSKYLHMNLAGVILATIVSLSFFAVVGPVQTYFILNETRDSG